MTKIVSGPGRCRSVPVLEMDDASGSDEERGQLKGIGSREVLLDQRETPVHEPSCGCWILHEQWNKTGVVEWQKFYFSCYNFNRSGGHAKASYSDNMTDWLGRIKHIKHLVSDFVIDIKKPHVDSYCDGWLVILGLYVYLFGQFIYIDQTAGKLWYPTCWLVSGIFPWCLLTQNEAFPQMGP